MNWKESRRGKFYSESDDGEMSYEISPKRNGNFFISAYRPGGAKARLPYQDFETAQTAIVWVEQHEQERVDRNARYAQEKPIRF